MNSLRRVVLTRAPVLRRTHVLSASMASSSSSSSSSSDKSNVPASASSQVIDDLFQLLENPALSDTNSKSPGAAALAKHASRRAAAARERAQLGSLQYWSLYPSAVKRWLINTKSPRGHYDWSGRYFPSGKWDVDGRGAAPVVKPTSTLERPIAASDIAGHFRFGVKPHEVADLHPKVRELLALEHGSKKEIASFRKQRQVVEFGKHDADTGRTEVQVATLTTRILALTEHMINNHKDKHTAYGLNRLVQRRRKLLRYLKRKDVARYYKTISKLELRDQ
eukprot:TRINITY_DN633_c0_g5_i1.p1 TRINITY_DN633_c0_g5~~TRINITY_DN633_c0_g5_i1.p1  ORF type:complete len:302 (+),score=109.18 TRINITY_DN633_c0_g5_i1:71-907(+)